jgi:hypothetical protein
VEVEIFENKLYYSTCDMVSYAVKMNMKGAYYGIPTGHQRSNTTASSMHRRIRNSG